MKRFSRTPAEQGFALLIVLWTMVLLALLATRITVSGRSETQIGANLRNAAVAEAAADGTVHDALFHLLASGGRRWALGEHHRVAFPDASADVTIESLAGRVNLNGASPELLRALLETLRVEPTQAASLAAAILDWRTPGRRPHPGGAKAAQYQGGRS